MSARSAVPRGCRFYESKALRGEVIMKSATTLAFGRIAQQGLLSALALISACGGFDTYDFRTGPSSETEPLTDLNGALVRLVRSTAPCGGDEAPDELIAFVGDRMEFPGEHVAALKSSCGRASAVSIDVEGRSIIYDFSHVASPGSFSSAEFDGYVLTDVWGSAPEIQSATIDRDMSTLGLDNGDLVVVDGHTLHINFRGRSFDNSTFIKIDLVLEEEEPAM